MLYLALVAGVLAYAIWMVALAGLGAARAAQILFLMAPLAAILEWASGRVAFDPAVAAGGALALAGIVLARPRSRSESHPIVAGRGDEAVMQD